MDKNKLSELRRIGYTIPRTCGLCRHGVFAGASHFGGCAIQQYDHLKHTESRRQLSIFRGGSCSLFEPSDQARGILGAYHEFLS